VRQTVTEKAESVIGGGLSETQAENLVTDFANIRRVIQGV
jgi:hypothetical protein